MISKLQQLPEWFFILAFLALVVVLWIYAARHWKNRKEELKILMPNLGYQPIAEPSYKALLPELLFHPNGFESMWGKSSSRFVENDIRAFVPSAWTGHLGRREVTVLDASISRRSAKSEREVGKSIKNRDFTVISCRPDGDRVPPDFLIEERVLFKGQVRGERSVNGPALMGKHYFLFSDAPQEELEPWITPRLRDQLGQVRLWDLAVHRGVFYLTRTTFYPEKAAAIPDFLREGEALLAGLFAAQ